jgi:hypothetical protein
VYLRTVSWREGGKELVRLSLTLGLHVEHPLLRVTLSFSSSSLHAVVTPGGVVIASLHNPRPSRRRDENNAMSLLRPIIVSGLLAAATAFSPTTTIGTANVISSHYAGSSRPSSSSSSALSMVAVDTSEIKNGLTIEIDGDPYKIMSFSIMKQARGAAKTTIKMKNLKRGNTIENTYRSGEKFETAEIIRKPSQYTYEDEVR